MTKPTIDQKAIEAAAYRFCAARAGYESCTQCGCADDISKCMSEFTACVGGLDDAIIAYLAARRDQGWVEVPVEHMEKLLRHLCSVCECNVIPNCECQNVIDTRAMISAAQKV